MFENRSEMRLKLGVFPFHGTQGSRERCGAQEDTIGVPCVCLEFTVMASLIRVALWNLRLGFPYWLSGGQSCRHACVHPATK